MEIDRVRFTEAVVEIGQLVESSTIPNGWATTAEMADFWGIGIEGARRRLVKLHSLGEVERRQLPNSKLLWRKVSEGGETFSEIK